MSPYRIRLASGAPTARSSLKSSAERNQVLIRTGLALALLALLAVTVLVSSAQNALHNPLNLNAEPGIFEVQQGDGLIRVLNTLESESVIDSALKVRVGLRLNGKNLVVKRGEYQLFAGETVLQLLDRMDRNDVILYPITIPEGVTFSWFLATLWEHPEVTRVLESVHDERLLNVIQPYASPEGLFLPETYLIQSGDTDLDVLVRARAAMQDALMDAWSARTKNLPLTEPYEALILASIVEKETGVASERPEIAGVFTRRLALRMRLQTDPTVIYGLGTEFDGNLTRRHLRDDNNQFNTYRIAGLPPTPIALPGKEAIVASLNPKDGEALYFVAKGDGSHAFSRTLSEHEENVRRYQLKRRKDYRSSPK
ncbi:MAG: endolytic transglycosylase MltG [Pseudomonadota bacterium]|nr:endolytic transglycosylase MltG [Pseudomonadota bacterium]